MLECKKLIKVFFALLVIQLGILSAAPQQHTLDGVVLDARSGEPVAGAYVRIKELNSICFTNPYGEFELLDLPEGLYTIIIGRIGYRSFEASIFANGSKGKQFQLIPVDIISEPVVVSSHRYISEFEQNKLVRDIEAKELRLNTSGNLANTLRSVPGFEIRSMGPTVAVPVVRGLQPSRFTVLENGIKINDLSATSSDHVQNLDISGVDAIEFISGAKMLTKTSSAFGSIINIKNNRIPTYLPQEVHLDGNIYAESMNESYNFGIRSDFPLYGLSWHLSANTRNGSNYRSPKGLVDNTDFNAYNISGGVAFIDDGFTIGFSGDYYANNYGIPGGFIGAHPFGVDIEMYSRNFRLFSAYHAHSGIFDIITANIGYSFYKHSEYEFGGIMGADFNKHDFFANIDFRTFGDYIFASGNYGIEYTFNNRKNGGFVFTPNTDKHNIAVYFYREHDFERLTLAASVRYEYSLITPTVYPGMSPDYFKTRDFGGFSYALGTLYQFGSGVTVGINLSRSRRTPLSEELYSEGPHLAAYTFEKGNPDLAVERGFGAEMNLFYNTDFLSLGVGLFAYDYSDYIAFRATGDTNWAQFLPIYRSESVRARLSGADASAKLQLSPEISLSNSVSFVIGENRNEKRRLPLIPPLKYRADLRYNKERFIAGLTFGSAAAQYCIDRFELPTEGYSVFGFYVGYSVVGFGVLHDFSLNISNLFDVVYYEHLSKLRAIMPEPGRNFRLNYKFFI